LAQWTSPSPQIIANGNSQLDESVGKRKAVEEFHSNDSMEGDDEAELQRQSTAKKAKVKTDLKQPKKTDGVNKVRIGKLQYPAHPFTIHVSNLSKETEDMDLVDAFRKEIGDIVHAKILREKKFGKGGHHFHGESKCAGLVQFEERISVEKALMKDGSMDVGGNLIKIQRSHLPAVGIVPQGMHRVNPKGDGKSTKRNKLQKDSKRKVESNEEKMDCDDGGGGKSKKDYVYPETPSSLSLSVLSFQPRAIKRKPILDTKK
jgi:RNA recognition motif-containing protein